jgi:hypothetical protein
MQNDPFDDFPKKAWRALREIKKELPSTGWLTFGRGYFLSILGSYS